MPRPKTATVSAKPARKAATAAKTDKKPSKLTKKPRRRAVSPAVVPVETTTTQSTANYIDISDVVANTERQNRTTIIIVSCLAVVIVGFWLWNMSRVLASVEDNGSLAQLGDEFKNLIGAIDNAKLPTNQTADDRSVDELKASVIEQIVQNIGIDQWLSHDSARLAVTAKYPSTWYVREDDDSLIISSYQSATNTPTVLGQVVIRRADNLTRLTPADWIKVTDQTSTPVELADHQENILGGTTHSYIDPAVDDGTFHQVLYTATGTDMYVIDLYARGTTATYRLTFDQIITTLTGLNP